MAKMWEEGIRVRDEDGVWMEDHNDTWQLNGTTKQTFIQREREYAKEFGAVTSGRWMVYGTNTYNFIAVFMFGHVHWDS